MKNLTKYKISDTDLFLVDGSFSVESYDGRGKKYYPLTIRELPNDQKPREKMLAHGSGALTLSELLSVILGTGTKKEELSHMTQRIIRDYGEKSLFDERKAETLAAELDIPVQKALQIIAVGELGRRFYEKKGGTTIIRTARDVFEYSVAIRNLPKEHLRGIYLNSQHKIVHDETISVGTLNASMVHPREVFRPALEYGAVAVILVHNHPSGDPTPSSMDIDITKQLVEAGKMLGVSLIDHVIVTREGFASVDISYE